MKIAIMQPYFLPYIGYFQLMYKCDRFILFDDVNFINRGWINRNRILLNNKEHLFTIPLINASQNRHINDILLFDTIDWRKKLFKKITQCYCSAPWFSQINPLINDIIHYPAVSLSGYLTYSINAIREFLDIQCTILSSSDCYANEILTGQERILDICHQEKASDYINLPGGKDLYQEVAFNKRNIELKILQPTIAAYSQFGDPFVPNLSILDVLMFNGREKTILMLNEARLQ